MLKRTLLAALTLAALCLTVTSAVADDKPVTVGDDYTLPKPADLKLLEGTTAGHKKPLDVLKKAIAASKDGKLDVLKGCFCKGHRDWLDEATEYKDKEMKSGEVVAQILAGWDGKTMEEMPQGKLGRYGVIMVKVEEQTYFVRCRYEKKNWFLYMDSYYALTHNWSIGMDDAIAAIKSGEGAQIKKLIKDEDKPVLELVSGEGSDPYAALAKKLKGYVKGKPLALVNADYDAICFWFHGEKADRFVVLVHYDNFDGTATVKLALWESGCFITETAAAFMRHVSDDPIYYDDGDDEKGDGGKGDGN